MSTSSQCNKPIIVTLQYVELAKTLRHYGRVPAGEAVTELSNVTDGAPEGTCRVRVSLASKELTLLSLTPPGREQRYKVTRMRCWRITTLHTVSMIMCFIRSPIPDGAWGRQRPSMSKESSQRLQVRSH